MPETRQKEATLSGAVDGSDAQDKAKQDVASRIYQYDYFAVAGDQGHVAIPGDYCYLTAGSVEGSDGLTMAFPRGGLVTYPQGVPHTKDFQQVFPDGATDEELRAALDKMKEQGEYRDAAQYRASKDGVRAAAFLRVSEGEGRQPAVVSVEREGTGEDTEFWAHAGVSGELMDSDISDYDGFNPEGLPVAVISDSDRYRREQQRAEAEKPVNRFLAVIGKAAGVKLGVKEPMRGIGRSADAYSRASEDLEAAGLDATLGLPEKGSLGTAPSRLEQMRAQMREMDGTEDDGAKGYAVGE